VNLSSYLVRDRQCDFTNDGSWTAQESSVASASPTSVRRRSSPAVISQCHDRGHAAVQWRCRHDDVTRFSSCPHPTAFLPHALALRHLHPRHLPRRINLPRTCRPTNGRLTLTVLRVFVARATTAFSHLLQSVSVPTYGLWQIRFLHGYMYLILWNGVSHPHFNDKNVSHRRWSCAIFTYIRTCTNHQVSV